MVTIIFESHGTTFDNEFHLSSGWFDAALSPLGERRARELGERYQGKDLDAIFVSDLQRSFRTAELAFAKRNIPIIKDQNLRECDYGKLTRHSSSEVEPARGQHITAPFPGGESYEQTNQRMKFFLESLLKNFSGKTVLIIGHRATQYGLESVINGVPLSGAVTAPWQWQPGWTYILREI